MANRSTLDVERPAKAAKSTRKAAGDSGKNGAARDRERVYELFRRWGFYEANLDPLDFLKPLKHPELNLAGPDAEEARAIYCGTIGAEFMHLPEADRRQWIAEQMESAAQEVDQRNVLERLIRADLFEQVLQARYLGAKRFSLEGVTSLIPLLDSLLEVAGENGAQESVIAMSHRGRLNVMVHTACKPAHQVVSGFEDVDPRSVLGAGDVKYHVGATGVLKPLPENRSAFTWFRIPAIWRPWIPWPWAVRAPNRLVLAPIARKLVVPIVMHGDAAFAGQGIWAETLNLADLKAYTVGGTIHVIVNNLDRFYHPSGADAVFAIRFGYRQAPVRSDFPRERGRPRRRGARRKNRRRVPRNFRQRRGGGHHRLSPPRP